VAKKNAFNTVTPLSKTIALVMFVAFPFAGFYLGIQYQKALDRPFMKKDYLKPTPVPPNDGVACTMEAKLCPNGVTHVGRTGPNCEFEKCPDEQ
jgi:hypothetical protein